MSNKQRRPVRFLFLLALAAAIVLAILYARCGLGGLGLGGGEGDDKGDGKPDSKSTQQLVGGDAGAGKAATPPCKLRLDGTGISVDGKTSTVAGAVDACKKAGSAEMTVVGDAAFGIRQELRDGLRAADVPVLER